MIQRIQSVFLLLAVIFQLLLFFYPLYTLKTTSIDKPVQTVKMTGYNISNFAAGDEKNKQAQPLPLPLTINLILIIGGIVTIFMFKNRKQQMTICRFLILLETALIVALVYALDTANGVLSGLPFNKSYSVIAVLPIINVVLFFLAFRAINKDEMKVRAADRLR